MNFPYSYENITSLENLLGAWREFVKGKRKKPDVQEFSLRLADNIVSLYQDLETRTYRHGGYQAFRVYDPKPRNIHKASVRGRLLHRAIYRKLYPFFDQMFIADSFSCRNGKGTHKATNRFRRFVWKVSRNHTKPCWVLKCDIKKFFADINHNILLGILTGRIQDENILWLLRQVVESFNTADFVGVGLPLGNLTSQLFANIYMNEFDQFVKHDLNAQYYLRYTDDFVILHHDDKYLAVLKDKIADFLKTHLDLSLHPTKVQIRKLRQGIDYLGYVSLPYARVPRVKVRRRIFRKLRYRVQQFKAGLISEESLMRSFDSYMGFLVHANSHKLREKLLQRFWQWVKEPPQKTKRDSRPAAHID